MKDQITEQRHYRDRQVVLYRRERSHRWQARFKLEKGGWYRFSTKEYELDKAAKYACNFYDESRYRIKYDKPQISRRFDSIAKTAITEMQKQLDAGLGKSVFVTYIAVIKLHLIPNFGHKNIDNITPNEYKNFYKKRETEAGKELTRSTINNYNSALNRIFDIAVSNGWMGKSQVPDLKNKGKAGERRPDFPISEYHLVISHLRKWAKKQGGKKISQMIRELLYDYVLFLANTGVRTGKEINNLKWKHLSWHKHTDGKLYLRIDVNGKTGKRSIVGRHNTLRILKRIQSRFPDLAELSFEQLIEAKKEDYIFRLSNGKRYGEMHSNFEQFLEVNNLLFNSQGEKRVLYSFRHTYATFALLKGMSIHLLAKNMGTSISMIEQHYSHLSPLMNADILAGPLYD